MELVLHFCLPWKTPWWHDLQPARGGGSKLLDPSSLHNPLLS